MNTSNYTDALRPFSYPDPFQYLCYTLYTLIFIPALIGNSLVISVVVTQPKMRTVTNYLIANLALGDLLMALLCVPFGFISILQQSWPFGEILCRLITPLQCVFVLVSAWTLVLLSLERWWGIVRWGRRRWGKRKVGKGMVGVWLGAVGVSVPVGWVVGVVEMDGGEFGSRELCEEIGWPYPTLRLTYTLTLLVLQYFLPIFVLIFTYSRITVEIWWKKTSPILESANASGISVREERLDRAKRRTISTLLLVVTTYTLSWLPLNLLYLYLEIVQIEDEFPFENFEYVYVFCHWLAMAHTTFNPIIYAWVNERFREGFRIVLTNCLPKCRKKNREREIYNNGGKSTVMTL